MKSLPAKSQYRVRPSSPVKSKSAARAAHPKAAQTQGREKPEQLQGRPAPPRAAELRAASPPRARPPLGGRGGLQSDGPRRRHREGGSGPQGTREGRRGEPLRGAGAGAPAQPAERTAGASSEGHCPFPPAPAATNSSSSEGKEHHWSSKFIIKNLRRKKIIVANVCRGEAEGVFFFF